MTTYRVGAAGATVFDADGRQVATLAPGTVVVEGTLDARASLAAQHHANVDAKRRKGYADKRLRPTEDKAG
jgi:hypothetical protein